MATSMEPSASTGSTPGAVGGTLLEQRADVQRYEKAWDELTAAALSPTASRRYIRDLIEESRP
ncbi:Scr1 family TA system antitoxin-like transcriptional regulator [Streptomyces sp. NPDC058240]|uniref:Scr1 family TA system antitoxin-like transcriptional regulator n=1 Tax=Streptomyces sp. NPDC058240 TaxID=3346396 RepID=UPI0036E62DA0